MSVPGTPAESLVANSPLPPSVPVSPAERRFGLLLILACTLLWSANGLFAKNPLFDSWPPGERGPVLAFWRALFAGLFLLLAVRKFSWNWWQLPLGGVFAGLNLTFMVALTRTTAANAIWLQATAPLWVLLLNALFLRHWPARNERLPLGLIGVGLLTILAGGLSIGGASEQFGIWMGLVSGICFAATVLLLGHLRTADPAWIIAVNHLLAAALMAPFCLQHGAWPTGWQWPLLAAFGVVQMGLPYLLFLLALRKVSNQEAACLTLLEPLLSPVWVFLSYGEQPALATMLGAGLILVGLIWQYTRPVVVLT